MVSRVLVTTAADGTDVRAVEYGQGRPVLIVHPGLDDGASWRQVAEELGKHRRVVCLHRRQYRTDLAARLPCSMSHEADDVLALARAIGEPMVLVGHSSGGVVALEALAAAAPALFAGAVLYEPPIHLVAGEWNGALDRAYAALTAGRPATAYGIFNRDIARMPPAMSRLIGLVVAAIPRLRRLVRHQIDDAAAINQLGVRLDTYATIEVPTVLLGGDQSPAHLADRMDALSRVLPRAEKVVLPGHGHLANQRAPGLVAQVIEAHASAWVS